MAGAALYVTIALGVVRVVVWLVRLIIFWIAVDGATTEKGRAQIISALAPMWGSSRGQELPSRRSR